MGFQSTLPVWGGTYQVFGCLRAGAFQSTLPVWGGTLACTRNDISGQISIHPPRVGRDRLGTGCLPGGVDFNPPSPCGEGHVFQVPDAGKHHFNPPSPSGEGRSSGTCFPPPAPDFNPPSPCGEGPAPFWAYTAPLYFNPPSPCGEGHLPQGKHGYLVRISIHPPRVGRDFLPRTPESLIRHFNPPSPCGEGRGGG